MTGSQFKALREKAELTQRRLAELFGKTIDTIARWERLEEVPLMAEYSIRWLAKPPTKEDRARDQSERDKAHVAAVRVAERRTPTQHDARWLHTALHSPDNLEPVYLAYLKSKYPQFWE